MRLRTPTTILVAVLHLTVLSRAAEPDTVGFLEFASKGGVPQEKADVLMDLIAEEIGKLGDLQVITMADVQSMLNLEKQKRLAGCTDDVCIAEISGALGVRWLVTGNVSRFAKTLVVNLKLLDARRALVEGRVSRRIRGDEDEVLEVLPEMVSALFERVSERLGLGIERRVTAASRHPQPLTQSPSAITVITREDIEASGAETLGDLLRMVPGMDVVTQTPFYTSITCRLYWNVENHQYLVLIDGREINDETSGVTFLQLQPIFLDDVKRIEVIRGPGSSLYGANALAGVISITTRAMAERTSGWARVSSGEPGRTTAGVRASTRISNWGFSLSGGSDVSGNFDDFRERGKKIWKIRSVVEYRFSEKERLVLEGGFTNGTGNTPASIGPVVITYDLRSLRLAYESEDLRGHLYWIQTLYAGAIKGDLVFSGVRLAQFMDSVADSHNLDGEFQWTLPTFFEPLMLMVGGRVRAAYIGSDEFLDAAYSDISSPKYHQPGMSTWQGRAGAYFQGELALTDWLKVYGGTRLDYNTETGVFVSPRLASVARLASGQFARLGVARSFRKPAFQETHAHSQVTFPDDSPITGPGQEEFLEFMSRAIGNSRLDNEELLSFEASYLGRFLDGRLDVTLDLYYNYHTNIIDFVTEMVADEQGLPDLERSKLRYENVDCNVNIFGGELSLGFRPSKYLYLQAAWAHREVSDRDDSPKNLITIGGRFCTPFGLLGSLYLFSRSEFTERRVGNPLGALAPTLSRHSDNVLLLLGKLGWRWESPEGFDVETGVKLFLPYSPFSGNLFRYYERAGGDTLYGKHYGAEQIARTLTAYLQGSF